MKKQSKNSGSKTGQNLIHLCYFIYGKKHELKNTGFVPGIFCFEKTWEITKIITRNLN